MNKELRSLYEADKEERINQRKVNTLAYTSMRTRDLQRRERVMEMSAANQLITAEDYFHAAHIMNHGDTIEDAQNLTSLRSVPVN